MTPKRGPATVNVAISMRTIGVVFAFLVILWVGRQLLDVFLVLTLAVVLATAVDQPVGWMERKGVPRRLGALAVFALLVLVLAAVVASLIPLLTGELQLLQDDLPDYANRLEQLSQRLAPGATSGSSLSFGTLAVQLSGHLEILVGRLTAITLAVGRTVVLGLTTLVIAYFLAVDPSLGPRLLARFAPASTQERVAHIATVAHARIGGWVRGQALVAVTFGAAMGVGLWLLGIPYAVSLGIVAAVLEVVPYVGGAVTVVLAVIAALTVGLPQVIGVVILYVVLVNLEAHVLSPIFLGHLVGLPSVAILIALLAGVEFLGIAGALLAVPLTVIAWSIVDEVRPVPWATKTTLGGKGRPSSRPSPPTGASGDIERVAVNRSGDSDARS